MDVKKLRREIMDFYGTAMTGPFPQATMNLIDVENMSDKELIEFAKNEGFIPRDYDDEEYER